MVYLSGFDTYISLHLSSDGESAGGTHHLDALVPAPGLSRLEAKAVGGTFPSCLISAGDRGPALGQQMLL